ACVPLVLAPGGLRRDRGLVAEHITPEAPNVVVRSNSWSSGDGLRLALERGAELSQGMDEFYGRNLAAAPRITEDEFVTLAQVYAKHARVENLAGELYEVQNWAEVDVGQGRARRAGGRGG